MKNNKASILPTLMFCLVLVVISAIVIFYKQRILDQIVVWQYQGSSEIINLVERAGMNDNGKFYYLASRPKLYSVSEAENFNKICERIEVMTVILGCYDADSRIHIYNVTSSQLDGIREVTAAHETLHAIYSRLSDNEKTELNLLLESEYNKLKSIGRYSELIAFYARTEPGQRDNELHSIIATVDSISPELEKYYSKYFSDRKKLVNLDTKYSGVFLELKERADELEKQMSKLLSSIKTRTVQYNKDIKELNNDIDDFNSKANSGQLSQSQFYYERGILQYRVSEIEKVRNNINDDMQSYDSMVIEHNKIAFESSKLYKTIDSNLVPTPSV